MTNSSDRKHSALAPTAILFNRLIDLIKSSINVDNSSLVALQFVEEDYKGVIFSFFELCPKLFEYKDDEENNILHCICKLYMDHSLSLVLLRYLLQFLPSNLLTWTNADGYSPVDIAVVFSTVKVINIILDFSSTSLLTALNPTLSSSSLLQLYVRGNKLQVLEKLEFLLQRDKSVFRNRIVTKSNLPILHACLELTECCDRMPEKFFYIPSLIIDLDPGSCSDIRIMQNCDSSKKSDNRLPLTTLINRTDFHEDSWRKSWTTMSPYYGLFKQILNAYPEVVKFKFSITRPSQSGISSRGKSQTTVYEYAMHFNLRQEYLRLILNACPDIDENTMRSFNFKARRLALWTSYRIPLNNIDTEFNILLSLRLALPDVFQRIVCYL